MAFDLENYVDVRQRIAMFREKYPNGSLQPANPYKPFEVVTVGDKTFVVYAAAAYRTPDDTRPGIGTAWEPVPGRTPYTKDSEVMNAETSAWGRAIIAALAVEHLTAIASAEEVRNRQEPAAAAVVPMRKPSPSRPAQSSARPFGDGPRPATTKQVGYLRSLAERLELGDAELVAIGGEPMESLTIATAKRLIDELIAVQNGQASLVHHDDGKVTVEHPF